MFLFFKKKSIEGQVLPQGSRLDQVYTELYNQNDVTIEKKFRNCARLQVLKILLSFLTTAGISWTNSMLYSLAIAEIQ